MTDTQELCLNSLRSSESSHLLLLFQTLASQQVDPGLLRGLQELHDRSYHCSPSIYTSRMLLSGGRAHELNTSILIWDVGILNHKAK